MSRMLLAAGLLALTAGPAVAADTARGSALAADCAACHGTDGVSVSADIPNLAAQKEDYLVAQLKAFRGGKRSSPYMTPIAASLDDDAIADIAAHFANLTGASPGVTGAMAAGLSGTVPAFPADYRSEFRMYHVIDFPDRNQVRHYWADAASVAAAKGDGLLPDGAYVFVEVFKAKLDAAGAPITGADGHFEADSLALYTAMQKVPGAGAGVPDLYGNGDWRYAVFSVDGAHKGGTNEAKCLACHKPEAARDYVFTQDRLREFAAAN